MAGVNRPPVPYRAHGVNPKAVDEVDLEYQRSVQELESGSHQPGWLFGKGAFDKTDLLFIRDHELQKRNEEEQVAHLEANEFAALRKQSEGEPSGSGTAGGGASTSGVAGIAPGLGAPSVARPPAKRAEHPKASTPRQLLPIIIKRQRTGEGLEDGGPLSSRASGGSLGSLKRGDSDALGSAGGIATVLSGLGGYGSSSDDEDKEDAAAVGGSGGRDVVEASGAIGPNQPSASTKGGGTAVGTAGRILHAGRGGAAVDRTGSGTKLPDAAALFGTADVQDSGTAVVPVPAVDDKRAQQTSSDASSDSDD